MNNKLEALKQFKPWRDPLGLTLLGIFLVLAVITSIVGFNLIRSFISGWTLTDLPGAPVTSGTSSDPSTSGSISEEILSSVTPVPWNGKSRVNILFFGLDYRECDETHTYEYCDNITGEASRTDSMILFTIDPASNTAGMLSIPRDLWVNIPGFDYGKITTAHFLGDQYNMPGGGPQVAKDTVSMFLGVPVDYYVSLNFNAFIRIVDELDGVPVTPAADMLLEDSSRMITYYIDPKDGVEVIRAVQDDQSVKWMKHLEDGSYLNVDPAGLVEHSMPSQVLLKGGQQVTLSGALALAYARNRKIDGGDFARSSHQQEIIMALKDRVMRFDMLPMLIAKAPALYAEVSSGVKTDLGLDQALQLATTVLMMPDGNITKAAITGDQLIQSTSPDGLFIYLPIPEEIRIIRDSIFNTGGTTSPMASGNTNNIQVEAARVVLYNATYTAGLGEQTQSYLESQGVTVTQVANATTVSSGCIIEVYNAKPYTLKYLSELFGVPTNSIYNKYDPDLNVDIAVMLGDSWAYNNPMQ